ncbi:MAG TPA: hypothetical protein VLU73_17195 [Methylococcaceae bacterium]|nr:hypothetical protein [Methylococcaceae bacterium]
MAGIDNDHPDAARRQEDLDPVGWGAGALDGLGRQYPPTGFPLHPTHRFIESNPRSVFRLAGDEWGPEIIRARERLRGGGERDHQQASQAN